MSPWLRIGEVARRTGLTTRTLRHYDDLGLLVPSGRSYGDYRLYGPDDLQRLFDIQQLKSLGLGLQEIAAALDDASFDARATLERHIALVTERLEAERELLTRLRRLQDAASAGWEEVLEVVALTERLRHPEPWVRFRAALEAPTVAPLDELVDNLRIDPEPGVREVLTWSIAQHTDALDAVVAQLHDPDAGVRLRMTHVLSKLADPRAVGPLTSLLGDPDAAVRAKATFALGQVGDQPALDALMTALGSDDPLLSDAVVAALARIGRTAVVPLVAALASRSSAVREQAADALGLLAAPDAVDPLAAVLDDLDPAVAFAAASALAATATPQARHALAAARTSPHRHVRLVADRASETARGEDGGTDR